MKRFILFATLIFASSFVLAESYKDWSTTNVSVDDGNTIGTTQVSVGVCPGSATTCPTLISAAVTNRGLRRRVISNLSSFKVYVGTNTTTLSTTGFLVAETTSTTRNTFETHSTAAIYGVAESTGTVTVITETNSAP